MCPKKDQNVETILKDIQNSVQQTADLDNKAPRSSRAANAISMTCAAAAALMFVVYILIVLLSGEVYTSVLRSFNVLFFFEVALVLVSTVLAVRELFRNIFLSSILSIGLCVLVTACIIIFLVTAYTQYNFILLAR